MIRTQIQLTEEQNVALHHLAKKSKKSVASLIRVAVDGLIVTQKPDKKALYANALPAIGKYASGQKDISEKHDSYLNEAFKG